MEMLHHEELKPLDLATFEQKLVERQKVSSEINDLYKGLYLGLPKGLRKSLRELSAKALNDHVRVPQSKRGILEAVTAIRLLGPEKYQALLNNRNILEAIDISLDASSNRVTLDIEETLDSTSNEVEEVMAETLEPTPLE